MHYSIKKITPIQVLQPKGIRKSYALLRMKIREGWIENLENVLCVLNCSSKIRLSDNRRTQLSLQHFPYKVAFNN